MTSVLKNHATALIMAAAGLAVLTGIAAWLLLSGWPGAPIRIGAILSLSGPAAHLVDVRDGMRLAVDAQNARGGINGRRVELTVLDSRTDPAHAAGLFRSMEHAADPPLVYLTTNSAVAVELAPLAEREQVVLVSTVTVAPQITQNRQWVFSFWSADDAEIKPVVAILRRLRLDQLGVLYLDDPFGRALFRRVREAVEAMGGVVAGQGFGSSNPDFGTAVARLADMLAIYVIGFTGHLERALRQLRADRYPGAVIGSSGICNLALTRDPAFTDGVYTAAPALYKPAFPFVEALKSDYERKTGRPFTHHSAAGFDSIMILVGLLQDREISREALRRQFEQGFVFQGKLGEINLRPGQHEITFPLFPVRIQSGRMNFLP